MSDNLDTSMEEETAIADTTTLEEPDLESDNPPKAKASEVDYKKRYSESSEEARRLVKENNAVIDTLYKRVENDNSLLIELAESNRSLAEKIAKKFIDPDTGRSISLDRALELIKGSKPKTKSDDDEEDIIEKVARRSQERMEQTQRKNEVKKTINDFLKSMDDEKQEAIIAKYQKLVRGEDIDPDTAKEYLEMAEAYVERKQRQEKTKDDGFESFHSSKSLGISAGDAPPKLSSASKQAYNQLFN